MRRNATQIKKGLRDRERNDSGFQEEGCALLNENEQNPKRTWRKTWLPYHLCDGDGGVFSLQYLPWGDPQHNGAHNRADVSVTLTLTLTL